MVGEAVGKCREKSNTIMSRKPFARDTSRCSGAVRSHRHRDCFTITDAFSSSRRLLVQQPGDRHRRRASTLRFRKFHDFSVCHLDIFEAGDAGHAVRLVPRRGAWSINFGASHMGGDRSAVFRGRQAIDEHGIRDRHWRYAHHVGHRTVRELDVSMHTR